VPEISLIRSSIHGQGGDDDDVLDDDEQHVYFQPQKLPSPPSRSFRHMGEQSYTHKMVPVVREDDEVEEA
jgi:hypothetical protein